MFFSGSPRLHPVHRSLHFQNFPPHVLDAAKSVACTQVISSAFELTITYSRYLFDASLKESPDEYQRLYDELKVEAALMAINSPYPEVRAVVANHDDPSVPASTFRTWVIGTIFVAAGYVNSFHLLCIEFLNLCS